MADPTWMRTDPRDPAAAPVRRREPLAPLVVVLAGVAALVLVATTAAVGLVGARLAGGGEAGWSAGGAAPDGPAPDGDSDDDGPPAREAVAAPDVIDAGASVLSGPGGTWTVPAADLLPGGRVVYLYSSDGPGYPEVLALADAVVVQVAVVDPAGPVETGVLAGLDPTDGTLLWRRETGPVLCEPVVDDTMLLCRQGLFDGDDTATYDLVDPRSGEVRGTHEGPAGVDGITSDRESIWLAGASSVDDQISIEVSELSTTDLGERWAVQSDLPADVDSLEGSLTVVHHQGRLQVGAAHAVVAVSDEGVGLGVEGSVEVPLTVLGEGYLAVEDYDLHSTTVTDADGNSVLVADGHPWTTGPRCCLAVSQGRVGIGDGLYDLTDGERLWGADEAGTVLGDPEGRTLTGRWSDDGRHLLTGDQEVAQVLLDAATGEPLWMRPAATVVGVRWTQDALVQLADGAVSAVAIDDSDGPAWSETPTVRGADPYDSGLDLALTDRAVVVAGDGGVQGWTSFSPAGGAREQAGGDTGYVTACGSEPELVPVGSDVAGGGVEITFEVHATCPSGEWWASSAQQVVLDSDPGGEVLAAGTFDFDRSPFWLPGPDDEPARLRLVFPAGTTYATPTEISRAVADGVVVVACESAPADRPVPTDASFGTPGTVPRNAVGPVEALDEDESALEALRRIAAEDAGAVADLDGSWVPQTSSKIEGTVDDGISYRYSDILEEHLRLRQRYPDVLLVNSDDYASYERPGYWVTLVADPSSGPDAALTWCSSRGFDRTHCYAKLLQRDGDPSGSTRQLPE